MYGAGRLESFELVEQPLGRRGVPRTRKVEGAIENDMRVHVSLEQQDIPVGGRSNEEKPHGAT